MKTFQSVDGHTIRSGMQVWVVLGNFLMFRRVGVIREEDFLFPEWVDYGFVGALHTLAYASYEDARFKMINDALAGSGILKVDRNNE